MVELYEAAFSGLNIVYSVMLLMVLLYWCIVMMGIIDFDMFDLDVGGDVSADYDIGGVEVGADASAEVDVDGAAQSLGGFSWLNYFNVGEVPIMLYGSIVVLTMWIISVQTNVWLDGVQTAWVQGNRGLIALGLAIPNFVFGMHVAKFLMLPVKRLKKEHVVATRLEGKLCLVKSLEVDENYGQVEIPTEDSSLLLSAKTENGEVLKKGDAAEIIRHVSSDGENFYVIAKHKDLGASGN